MAGVKRSMSTQGGGPRKYSKSASKGRRPKVPASANLGKITGKVAPNSTTLATAKGPFSGKKFMTFLYENALTKVNPASPLSALSVLANSLYDFDKTTLASFGNKQPLYYDTVLTASGPYKSYQVISWKTTYTVVNMTAVPISVWAVPPTIAANEIDSVAEADNFPGVKKLSLSQAAGSKNIGTITVWGHQNDLYPVETLTANSTTASYAGDPASPCYAGLIVASADGTTNVEYYVAVEHEAYAELFTVDALVS